MLLKSLVIIGAILGLFLAVVGTSVPWLFPTIFTPDKVIIKEVSSCFSNSQRQVSSQLFIRHCIIQALLWFREHMKCNISNTFIIMQSL